MSWAKIDDGLATHPKTLQCDLAATGLWTRCLSWSAQQLSDGFIPKAVPKMFGASGNRLPGQLVAAGLWEPVEGGWQIHDYLDYNPSRDQVLEEREAQHQAKVRAGQASAKARREGTTGTAIPSGARNHPDRATEQTTEQADRSADRSAPPNTTEQTPNPVPTRPVPEAGVTCIAPSLRSGAHPAPPSKNGEIGAQTSAPDEDELASGRTPRSVPQARPAKSTPAGEDGSAPPCPKCGDGHVDQLGKFLGCRQCGWVVEGSLASEPIPPSQEGGRGEEVAAAASGPKQELGDGPAHAMPPPPGGYSA